MPKYIVETNQGKFEIEADNEPTQADVQKYLDATTATDKEIRSSDNPAVRRSRIGESPSESLNRAGARSTGLATDLLLEGAIPAAAQAAAAETGPRGMAIVGGGTSALGNILAQARRVSAGEQEGFSLGQLGAAAATGAIPVAGPEANAARLVARPFISKVINAGVTSAKLAGIGAAGENIKLLIDEGRLARPGEDLRAGLLPGVIGFGASAGGEIAEGISRSGRNVAENARDYSSISASPTPGMLLPETLAGTEQKIAARLPKGEVAGAIDAVKGDLQTGIQQVAPNPQEGAEIFKTASPLIRQIKTAEDELSKLNGVAKKANRSAEDAFTALGEAKAAGKADVQKTMADEAEKLSNESFNANLASAMENAKELATNRAVGGSSGVDPATGRDLFVEHVSKPVLAAFDKRAAELYSVVDNQAANFDAKPILTYARQLASDVTGGLPKKLDAAIALVTDNLGTGEKVSLQALRNARAELLRKVRLGDLDSNNEERLVKGIASEITKQIDSQAVKALGQEGGEGLLAANKFYREGKELFDQEGVDALFASKPNDGAVRKIIAGMERSGVNADEYKNVQTLIERIGKDSPGLAESAQTHLNDIVKRSVIYDASRVAPGSAGELVVDGEALLASMRKLGKVPGTLEKLGMGSPAAVGELETLFAKYPEATKMTSKDWDQIFSSPAFRASVAGKPWSKTELATNIADTLAASQADNQIIKAANLKAAGKTAEASAAYGKAVETLRSANGDVAAAKQKYETLAKDPVALAFNNPNLSDQDFNSFAKALFDPKASKVTNGEVSQMADSLRRSANPDNKALLLRLQERYIADKVAAYHSTPTSSSMLKHPDTDAVALFFNPVNPGDAANELARARALLEPAQLNQLAAFSRTAKAIGQYEKLGVVPVRAGSYDIPVVGMVRRGLDAVADLYREGKYATAAKLLADPEKFSKVAITVGDTLEEGADSLQRFGVGAGRVQSNRRNK